MNYKEFSKALKSRDLKTVYLFFGEEEYLLDSALAETKNTLIDSALESLNYIELNGEDLEFNAIMNACETLPFMAEKKMVIIRDLPIFKVKKKEELSAADELLINYIGSLEDYLLLIFVEKANSMRKSNAFYKKIQKTGEIVEFSKLKGKDLENWVESSFKKHHKNISKADINYFINYSSYLNKNLDKNLYDLENEVLKISNYLDKNTNVNREEVELLMTRPLEMNIFNLLNAISQKDGEMALRLFNEMYISNEPILIILHMIIRQLRNMLKYKLLMEKGYTWGDSLKKMGLSEYEYKKISNQSKNFAIGQLELALEYALDADRAIKTTATEDKLIMEILIANLCFKL